VTFLDEFFTEDFCREKKFFNFGMNERTGNYEIESREFKKIKERLLFQLTNFGDPFIFVDDANHENRGELLMRHRHEGTDLNMEQARATMTSLFRIWRRPVNLLTALENKKKILRFDGKDHTEKTDSSPGR
jgi:stage V sporulation protein R